MLKLDINSSKFAAAGILSIAAAFLIFALSEYGDRAPKLATNYIDRSELLNQTSYFAGDRQDHRRWVLVNFWASWCAPCREEMPLLETLHREQPWGDDFSILTLSQDQDANPLKAYWNRYRFKMEGRIDTNQFISFNLNIEAYPATILISPDHEIVKIWPGIEDWSDIEMTHELSQLMSKSTGDSL